MKKIILILITISGMLAAETLTFEQAVNIALEENLSIQMSENALQMTKNYVNPGILLPTISLTGNSNFTSTTPDVGADFDRHINSAGISTKYTLFSGFNVLNSYKKLKLQYGQSELQTRYQVENIIYGLAQAYYNLANAKEQLELSKESLRISGDRLKRTLEQEKLGRINKVELLSAEVDYNRDSITVETAKLNYENSFRNLNILLNKEIDDTYEIETKIEQLRMPEYNDLKSSAFENNSDYKATMVGIDLAEMDIKLANSSFYPTVNLTGSYGLNQTNMEFDPSLGNSDKVWSVGLSLNFSLFNGFQRKIKKQNAKISLDNQKLALQQSKLELEKQIASQYTTYINSIKTLEMEKLNLVATKANFERTKELYNLGQLTAVRFREAQLNLLKVKSNISAGKYSVKLNEIALLQLSGKLLD